jgi:Uncharacterized protein conserved in bacteria
VPLQVQLIIFAVIAAVVLFQLYRVLGKPIGRMPEDDAKAAGGAAAQGEAKADPTRIGSPLDAAAMAAIAGLKARDASFDPNRFLEGARQAHEAVVRAYASGDREALKPLLTPGVMASFDAGITAREARGETDEAEFVHPARADLELATAEGNKAIAKVRFLAEIRNTLSQPGGEPRVEERRTAEVWTFERTLGASDPNWLLARVQPAEA